jgi:hypothetical protein
VAFEVTLRVKRRYAKEGFMQLAYDGDDARTKAYLKPLIGDAYNPAAKVRIPSEALPAHASFDAPTHGPYSTRRLSPPTPRVHVALYISAENMRAHAAQRAQAEAENHEGANIMAKQLIVLDKAMRDLRRDLCAAALRSVTSLVPPTGGYGYETYSTAKPPQYPITIEQAQTFAARAEEQLQALQRLLKGE